MDDPPQKALTLDVIDPGKVYTVAEVAPLLRAQPATIRGWVRAGLIEACPRATIYAPVKFRGQVILDRLGYKPPPVPEVQSKRARKKAAQAELDRFQKILARK